MYRLQNDLGIQSGRQELRWTHVAGETHEIWRMGDQSNGPLLHDFVIEPCHEISNNVVCGTSKGSDQPAHTYRLIEAFACRSNIL